MKKLIVAFGIAGLSLFFVAAAASDAAVLPFGWILSAALLGLLCILASALLSRAAKKTRPTAACARGAEHAVLRLRYVKEADLADVVGR